MAKRAIPTLRVCVCAVEDSTVFRVCNGSFNSLWVSRAVVASSSGGRTVRMMLT